MVLFDGSATLPPMTVRVGQASRLRVVHMTLRRSGARVRIIQSNSLVGWRVLPKNGAGVPAAMSVRRIASKLL